MSRTELVREHQWNEIGRCIHCGQARWEQVLLWFQQRMQTAPESDTRLCRWRRAEALRPEPVARNWSCEDVAAIAARLAELATAMLAALNRPEGDVPPSATRPAFACEDTEAIAPLINEPQWWRDLVRPAPPPAAAAIDANDCCF